MEFPFCHVDTGSGIPEFFVIFSVSKACVVAVFVSNRTEIDFLCTAIADIRSPVKPAAAFFFKAFAGLITGGTGSALHAAKDNLAAGIGLFTMVTMDTEVFRIIKSAFVIPVRQPMSSYFFRDGSGILAQESGDIFKGCTLVQFVFNINTIFKSKMLLVTRNIFTHSVPPSTAVRRRDNHNISV